MTDSHKAALERGRAEGRVVRDYLEALRSNKPKRGRKRTADSINKRLAAIDDELSAASAIEELQLIQERRDLNAELASLGSGIDLGEIEDSFVERRQGIWRTQGHLVCVVARCGCLCGDVEARRNQPRRINPQRFIAAPVGDDRRSLDDNVIQPIEDLIEMSQRA